MNKNSGIKNTGFILFFVLIAWSANLFPIRPCNVLSLQLLKIGSVTGVDSAFSFIGVGDIMMGTNYPDAGSLPKNGGVYLFDQVRPIFKNADVVFGNLEGILLDSGKTVKTVQDSSVLYLFRQPTSYGKVLKEAGFSLLSIGNNHINDFGPKGIKSTVRVLRENGIACAGIISQQTAIIEKNGKKIGLAAFSFNGNTVNINDSAAISKNILKLRAECNFVLVSFHGGSEGGNANRVLRKLERFKEENRGNVYRFAHLAINAGADVVFGHGPHVARSIELYKNKFIAYSLGNFCTTTGVSLKGACGFAPIIKVVVNSHGDFVSGKIIPIYQKRLSGPLLDPGKRSIKEISHLTKLDFPGSSLIIDDEGSIRKSERKISKCDTSLSSSSYSSALVQQAALCTKERKATK
ncbi:MAG: CapA family protein [Ignavibacteria bacterium]|nr:CapA family protein [Ignavibacteria bacterium]